MGSKRCCSFAEEASLFFAVVKSREAKAALSGVFFFFKWWFSKRGTKKAKQPPQPLPALLQRPYLGKADGWSHLQPKNWPEPCTFVCTSLADPPRLVLLGAPQTKKSCGMLVPEQHRSSLSRDTLAKRRASACGTCVGTVPPASTEDGLDPFGETGWGVGSCASRQSHFDTRGNAAHSDEMVVSAAADFNLLCCHPPTSRKAGQAMLTTPTGNLPSD